MTIGICDYGIGGTGLYKLLRQRCTADVVYFSDSGYTPYGKVPEAELRARLNKVIAWFNSMGIEKVAVACNAASTVLPASPHVTGVIEHSVSLVLKAKPGAIAITGGVRTIESNQYKNALARHGIAAVQQVAQKLSARIEAGDVSSAELDQDIAEIFGPLQGSKYILLACTHYPAIAHRIRAVVPEATLLDPAEEMAAWILEHWKPLEGNGTVRWYTSGGTAAMKNAAWHAFRVEILNAEKKEL
jgi:glutamate racemase